MTVKKLIGQAPSQAPRNRDLGSMAYQDANNYFSTAVQPTFRNRIINGDMRIDQRNGGSSKSLAVSTAAGYMVDRWTAWLANWTGGSATGSQSSDVPANSGFTKSFNVTVTGAGTPDPTSGRFLVHQKVEGFNFSDFKWGTSNAQTASISFWVKCSVTGSFALSITNNNGDRAYVATYTVNAANTWEYKTLTIPGDTSGTWATDNNSGVILNFDLGVVGPTTSTYNTWLSGDYRGGATTTKLAYTNGATWYITGVQLEKGTVATPFEFRPYGTELALCQRYCWVTNSNSLSPIGAGSTYAWTQIIVPTVMRAAPTVTTSGLFGISDEYSADITGNVTVGNNQLGNNGGRIRLDGWGGTLTTYRPYHGTTYASGSTSSAAPGLITLSAEL